MTLLPLRYTLCCVGGILRGTAGAGSAEAKAIREQRKVGVWRSLPLYIIIYIHTPLCKMYFLYPCGVSYSGAGCTLLSGVRRCGLSWGAKARG